ncbi:dTMP kinase [Actinacidiphila yanglinensis]|uniref:Thymidylate kinase n=1 Tax=Actinacidiphila yanglinensis TaxID=310779 RepID=A0A1H6E913_9ACTN|nr:dTMP kinase [Actinacidiphila yanglinensis]SEG94240.1 dTMP kinase [Actinacidiphila yanglinensis]
MARGGLIAVSGIDGSGKSTLVSGLVRRLAGRGRTVRSVAALKPRDRSPVDWASRIPQPGDAQARERWIAGYFTLVLASNAAEVVAPALDRGEWVVADRWALDHVANQRSFGLGLEEWMTWLKALPQPDVHLLVDVPPKTAARRIAARGKDPGVGHGRDFLSRCRGHMRQLAEEGAFGPVTVLDGSVNEAALLDLADAAVPSGEAR